MADRKIEFKRYHAMDEAMQTAEGKMQKLERMLNSSDAPAYKGGCVICGYVHGHAPACDESAPADKQGGGLTDEEIASQDARHAIDGAIAYGRMGVKEPPPGHWLTEYWCIGKQLAELGKTSIWDNQTPIDSIERAVLARVAPKDSCYVCGQPAMYCASKHHEARVAPSVPEGFASICREELARSKLVSLPRKLEFARERGMSVEDVHDWMRHTAKAFENAVQSLATAPQPSEQRDELGLTESDWRKIEQQAEQPVEEARGYEFKPSRHDKGAVIWAVATMLRKWSALGDNLAAHDDFTTAMAQTMIEYDSVAKTAEEARGVDAFVPRTPEQMIEFMHGHFDSMEAEQWDDAGHPAGDLSRVRYSVTVHDLLSAFDWAGLLAAPAAAPATEQAEQREGDAVDAALRQAAGLCETKAEQLEAGKRVPQVDRHVADVLRRVGADICALAASRKGE